MYVFVCYFIYEFAHLYCFNAIFPDLNNFYINSIVTSVEHNSDNNFGYWWLTQSFSARYYCIVDLLYKTF